MAPSGFADIEGVLLAPCLLQPRASSFSHSPGGKELPRHKEFSQEIPRSPATSSTLPTCLSVRDTWCPIGRPQIGQLFRTQGFYSQSGPEPGSRIDSEMEQLRFLPLSLGRIMLPVCSLTLFLSLWGRYI